MGDVIGQAWWEADLKDDKLKAKLRELDVLLRQQGQMSEASLNAGWTKALDNAGRGLQNLGRNISSTGDSMTRNLTLPIVGVGVATGKMALDYETTMNRIVGLTDVTRDAIGGISDEILAMGSEVGKGPQELAEAFYFVASAGFKADEAMEVLRVSARAAASGLGETQTIAQVLGGVINAYGRENITAARAADILTEAVSQGTAEASGFAAVIGNVVPGAAALGVSFDQVTAAMAGMTLSGVGVEESATSLIQIFSSLQKPTVQAEAALEGMGTSSAELRRQLREEGLLATLRTLEERFAGNETASAAVFGNIRALRGVTALLTLDNEQLNAVFEKVNDSQGRAATAYDETEGSQRDLARSMAEIQALAIELGTDVLPVVVDVLKDLAGGAREFSRWWRSLDDDTKRWIVQMAAVLAIAGPVLSLVGKLTTGVGGLFRAVAWLAGPTGLVKLVQSLSLAKLGVLGLIGAVVGLGFAVGDQFKTVLDDLTRVILVKLGEQSGKTADQVDTAVGRIANAYGSSIPDAAKKLIKAVEEHGGDWDAAMRDLVSSANEMGLGVDGALEESGRTWEAYQNQISGGTQAAVDEAALIAAGLPPEIASTLAAGGPGVGTAADGMTQEMIDAAAAAREAVLDEMDTMLAGMGALFDSTEAIETDWQDFLDRLAVPYTDHNRRIDLEARLASGAFREALASEDTGLINDAVLKAEALIAQYETLQPGALAAGALVNPALREGMDADLAALITWIETNITHEALDAMSLDDAEGRGLGGIWSYANGMKRNEQLAKDTAWAIKAGAAANLNFDASPGGAAIIHSWMNGMSAAWNARYAELIGMSSYARNVLGGSLPTIGPLKGGVFTGGFSIGASWIGGLVRSIDAGRKSVAAAIGGVGDVLTSMPLGGLYLDYAGATAAAGAPGSAGSPGFVPAAPTAPGNASTAGINFSQTLNVDGLVKAETPFDIGLQARRGAELGVRALEAGR